jgi:hypothetical protein
MVAPYNKVNRANCQETNIFFHHKNTSLNHGISTSKIYLLTFVGTYNLVFTVVCVETRVDF